MGNLLCGISFKAFLKWCCSCVTKFQSEQKAEEWQPVDFVLSVLHFPFPFSSFHFSGTAVLDDCNFHESVIAPKFETDHTLRFVPSQVALLFSFSSFL
jgi:hypothetical protein